MHKYVKHRQYLDYLHKIYLQKNAAYGDSFTKSIDEFGLISSVISLSHKLERYKSLVENGDLPEESMIDTLLDMANYAIMSAMYISENGDNMSTSYDSLVCIDTETFGNTKIDNESMCDIIDLLLDTCKKMEEEFQKSCEKLLQNCYKTVTNSENVTKKV